MQKRLLTANLHRPTRLGSMVSVRVSIKGFVRKVATFFFIASERCDNITNALEKNGFREIVHTA